MNVNRGVQIKMSENQYDLLINAGRVFCAASGLDGSGSVAVRGDRIVAAGADVQGTAAKVLDFPDDLLLPGLVDVHAHPAHGGSKYGVDPDVNFLPRGVTTVMSQGDAGANNLSEYQEHTIRAFQTRIVLAISLAAPGESKEEQGCFEDLDDVDVEACVRAIEENREGIWGIALNTVKVCCGNNDPDEILARAVEVGERTGKPLLFGSRGEEDSPLAGQLAKLRPGDVVTYCFNPRPQGLLRDGQVRDEVWAARQRGVLFDAGHGMGSFSFAVAAACIEQGFLPDTISTDQYRKHVDSVPQHDLPRTLSKLLAVGMPEDEAMMSVTARSAEVLGLAGEVGTLALGACADLTLLRWNLGALPLCDVSGEERPGGCWEAKLVVRGGKVVAGGP